VLVPILIGLVWWRLHEMASGGGEHARGVGAALGAAGASSGVVAPASRGPAPSRFVGGSEAGLSVERYLAQYQARIPGLAFTAPAYDGLTKPVEAPYPAVCAFSADFPCRCWSQRGFSLVVPADLCRRLAAEPMDPYWRRRGPMGLEIQGGVSGEAPADSTVGSSGGVGPSGRDAASPGG